MDVLCHRFELSTVKIDDCTNEQSTTIYGTCAVFIQYCQ